MPERGLVGIGRDQKCAIRLPDGMSSRVHCIIRYQSGQWILEDNKSSNGTFVNDQPITRKPLAASDVIRVGETLLSFSEDVSDPMIGQTLAGYRIEKRIGRGAVGTVYRAVQLSLERTVAIKILAPRFAKDEDFVRKFLEEARAAGRLNHPNVVQVYDAGKDGEHYYISMEFLEKGTLEELLAREGRIPAEQAVGMATDAAKALSFAEQSHIVHRDIKPANLLIAGDGTVKVGDLGIAADLRAGTTADSSAGSPRYMAPEQVRKTEIDHRADIYALGSTLYRMISGSPPFDGASAKEILSAKLQKDPMPLRARVPDLPPAVSEVVQKMMARSPGDRYPTAAEAEQALARSLVRPVGIRKRRARRTTATATTSQWLLGAASVVVFLVIVLVVVGKLLDEGSEQPDVSGPPDVSEGPGGSTRPVPPPTGETPGPGPIVEAPRPGDTGPGTPESPPGQGDPLKEVASIHAAFSEGSLSAQEAEARLQTLRRRHRGNTVLAREVERSLSAIQAQSLNRQRALVTAKSADVNGLIGADRLREAAQAIRDFKLEHGLTEELISPLTKALERAVQEKAAAVEKALSPLTAAGKFDEARQLVEKLEQELPRTSVSEVVELRKKITDAEQMIADRAEIKRELRLGIIGAIAALDFKKAEGLIDSADPPLRKRLSVVERQLRLTRSVWARLLQGLKDAAANQRALRLAPQGAPAEAPTEEHRISEIVGYAARLESGSGRDASSPMRAVLSFDTENLLQLIGKAPDLTEKEARQGLGLLLLLRRGAERAAPLLLATNLEPAERQSNDQFVSEVASLWLQGRVESATQLHGELKASSSAVAADAWGFVADEAAALIEVCRTRQDSRAMHEGLWDLYLKSREEVLLRAPQERYFHTTSVRKENGGLVTLEYDFSSEDHLKAFHAVDEIRSSTEWVERKKLLKLGGEFRFLRGDPFRDKLKVSAWIPSRGYTDYAPNVNVAFWTREEDQVTTDDLDKITFGNSADRNEDVPSDYFVLGHGYRLSRFVRRFTKDGTTYDPSLRPKYLEQPTFVLFGGYRGGRLHNEVFKEIFWEEPITVSLRRGRSFYFSAAMDGGKLEWTVNGRPREFHGAEKARCLAEKAPHSGSVTFFTNKSTVLFTKIEITGKVDPQWFRDTARSWARLEKLHLEPRGLRSFESEESKSEAAEATDAGNATVGEKPEEEEAEDF